MTSSTTKNNTNNTAVVDLQLNDPVNVIRSTHQMYFEGIVAHLGPVKFGDRSNDWVGVRLTGNSVGLGKNDGSVQSERYFRCSPQGGVFVRKNKVIRRVLTRLEFLRLRKELAIAKATELRNNGDRGWKNTLRSSSTSSSNRSISESNILKPPKPKIPKQQQQQQQQQQHKSKPQQQKQVIVQNVPKLTTINNNDNTKNNGTPQNNYYSCDNSTQISLLSDPTQVVQQQQQQQQQQQKTNHHKNFVISVPADDRRGSMVSTLSMRDDVVFNNKLLQHKNQMGYNHHHHQFNPYSTAGDENHMNATAEHYYNNVATKQIQNSVLQTDGNGVSLQQQPPPSRSRVRRDSHMLLSIPPPLRNNNSNSHYSGKNQDNENEHVNASLRFNQQNQDENYYNDGNDPSRRQLPTRSQSRRRDSHQSISIAPPFRSRDSNGHIIVGERIEEGENGEEAEMDVSYSYNKQIRELDDNTGKEKIMIGGFNKKNKQVIAATKSDSHIIINMNNKKGKINPPPLSPIKIISIPKNRRGTMVSTLSLDEDYPSTSHHYGANSRFSSTLRDASPGLRQSQRQEYSNDNSHQYNYNNNDDEVASTPLQYNKERRDSHHEQSIEPPSRKGSGHRNENHTSQQMEIPPSGIDNQSESLRYFDDDDIINADNANRGINDGYDDNMEGVKEAAGITSLDRMATGRTSNLGKAKSGSLLPMTNFERIATGKTSNITSNETEIEEDNRSHNNPLSVVAFSHNKKGSVVSTLTMQHDLATSRSGRSQDRRVSNGHNARLSPSPPRSNLYKDSVKLSAVCSVGMSAVSSVDGTNSMDYSKNSGSRHSDSRHSDSRHSDSVAMDAVKPGPNNMDDYNEEEALVERVNKKTQKRRSTFKISNTSNSSPPRQSRTRVYQEPGNRSPTSNSNDRFRTYSQEDMRGNNFTIKENLNDNEEMGGRTQKRRSTFKINNHSHTDGFQNQNFNENSIIEETGEEEENHSKHSSYPVISVPQNRRPSLVSALTRQNSMGTSRSNDVEEYGELQSVQNGDYRIPVSVSEEIGRGISSTRSRRESVDRESNMPPNHVNRQDTFRTDDGGRRFSASSPALSLEEEDDVLVKPAIDRLFSVRKNSRRLQEKISRKVSERKNRKSSSSSTKSRSKKEKKEKKGKSSSKRKKLKGSSSVGTLHGDSDDKSDDSRKSLKRIGTSRSADLGRLIKGILPLTDPSSTKKSNNSVSLTSLERTTTEKTSNSAALTRLVRNTTEKTCNSNTFALTRLERTITEKTSNAALLTTLERTTTEKTSNAAALTKLEMKIAEKTNNSFSSSASIGNNTTSSRTLSRASSRNSNYSEMEDTREVLSLAPPTRRANRNVRDSDLRSLPGARSARRDLFDGSTHSSLSLLSQSVSEMTDQISLSQTWCMNGSRSAMIDEERVTTDNDSENLSWDEWNSKSGAETVDQDSRSLPPPTRSGRRKMNLHSPSCLRSLASNSQAESTTSYNTWAGHEVEESDQAAGGGLLSSRAARQQKFFKKQDQDQHQHQHQHHRQYQPETENKMKAAATKNSQEEIAGSAFFKPIYPAEELFDDHPQNNTRVEGEKSHSDHSRHKHYKEGGGYNSQGSINSDGDDSHTTYDGLKTRWLGVDAANENHSVSSKLLRKKDRAKPSSSPSSSASDWKGAQSRFVIY